MVVRSCHFQDLPDRKRVVRFLVLGIPSGAHWRRIRNHVLDYSCTALTTEFKLRAYVGTVTQINRAACHQQTEVQRVYQLGVFKTLEEQRLKVTLDDKKIFALFRDNIRISSGENCTQNFVSSALNVWKTVISNPELKAILLLGDEMFGRKNVMDSLTKLEAVVQTARSSPDMIKFMLLTMFDLLLNGDMKAEDMSRPLLQGKRTGNKGRCPEPESRCFC